MSHQNPHRPVDPLMAAMASAQARSDRRIDALERQVANLALRLDATTNLALQLDRAQEAERAARIARWHANNQHDDGGGAR